MAERIAELRRGLPDDLLDNVRGAIKVLQETDAILKKLDAKDPA